ncbi:hypothetical protein BD626DRAFT_277579 [Schizophyllum amplum]|uniref:Uncharacterized protein n=1 Tax=Schizophyllum amplum TaxID=97359 RepID=A0A550BTF0_9AGAR|nr:hypothetical protein BD626DRAFT_277579 [Auriculariopsis ampla]
MEVDCPGNRAGILADGFGFLGPGRAARSAAAYRWLSFYRRSSFVPAVFLRIARRRGRVTRAMYRGPPSKGGRLGVRRGRCRGRRDAHEQAAALKTRRGRSRTSCDHAEDAHEHDGHTHEATRRTLPSLAVRQCIGVRRLPLSSSVTSRPQ